MPSNIFMEQSLNPPVYLRALEVSDLERIWTWHNNPTLYELLGGNFRWVSHIAEEEWIRQRSVYSTNEVNLAICLSDSHAHIGNIYLRDINWVVRHAELHIFIGEQTHRGHGYGASAMQQMLDHVFKDLGLQRIFLFVLVSNAPAIRLYKKCGLKEEGCLRHHSFKNGALEDVLVMGILSSEWANSRTSNPI